MKQTTQNVGIKTKSIVACHVLFFGVFQLLRNQFLIIFCLLRSFITIKNKCQTSGQFSKLETKCFKDVIAVVLYLWIFQDEYR